MRVAVVKDGVVVNVAEVADDWLTPADPMNRWAPPPGHTALIDAAQPTKGQDAHGRRVAAGVDAADIGDEFDGRELRHPAKVDRKDGPQTAKRNVWYFVLRDRRTPQLKSGAEADWSLTTLTALIGSRPLRRGDESEAVRAAQVDLIKSGAELTPDGRFGPITEAAVRRFQAAHNIAPSGVVDSLTARHLDGIDQTEPTPGPALPSAFGAAPWLSTMRAITGTREVPGDADSPFVLGMAAAIGQRFPDLYAYSREYRHDSIPWCGLTIAYVVAINGIRPVTKVDGAQFGFLWADDWKHAGVACELRVGAIGVFTRNGGGHVSLIEGWDGTHALSRGGNQSDMINVTRMSLDKLTATRWPAGYPLADVVGLTSNAAPAGKVT